MTLRDSTRLILLAAIWGASFLFNRITAPLLGPVLTAELRTLIAGVALAIWFAATGFNPEWRRLDTPAEMFEKVWRLGCYAGFLFGREAARCMAPRGKGTILFTGATASLRGAAQFAAFAAAKGGLRQVAQSMARELGPKNIHVAHIVIDGMIDNPRTRSRMAERVKDLPPDGMLATDAIAELFWQLHAQPRSAWTFEADLRPWAEKF